MALFDGMNRWWRQSSAAPLAEYRPHHSDAAREALTSSVLRQRYPDALIYQALAQESGCDPLRAVELQ